MHAPTSRIILGATICMHLASCSPKEGESRKLKFPFLKKSSKDTVFEEETEPTQAVFLDTSAVKKAPIPDFVPAAYQIFNALKQFNYQEVAKHIHPEMGVSFSPYGFIDSPLHFSALKLIEATSSDSIWHWGYYDGSGDSVIMTFVNYHKDFVFCPEFIEHVDTSINKAGHPSNSLNNFAERFPDAQYIDFYVNGTEEYGYLDWRTLRLGFVKKGRRWYLVAIIHDEWTI